MREAMHAAGTAATSERERLAAVGSIIWRDRELLLATAARASAGGTSLVECGLRGASMATAIPAGSRLRVACGQREPQVGDVVVFSIADGIVAHRVVYRRRRGARSPVSPSFLTRGDARVVPDAPLAPSALIGHVLEFDSGAGWRPVGAARWVPRRQRALALATLAVTAVLFELSAGAARRFVAALDALVDRYS